MSNFGQKIILLKGKYEIPVGEDILISSYYLFEFPLGPIQKDFHENNKIIIKNQPLLENDNKPIYFDYLELDDQDQDGDGSLDGEEFEGNTDKTDMDNLEDKYDPDTASILIESHDQSITKRIILDIEEEGVSGPYFQELTLLDQNSHIYSSETPGDIFFPYGLFSVKICISVEEGEISLRIICPEKIYPLVQFYLYNESNGWQIFGSYADKPGRSIWLGKGYLTTKEIYPVNLLVHWKVGEKEPWCLATNLPDQQMTLRFYAFRMWIEEMYGDFKKHGFDLERTMLRHFQRLSRLTLAVAILYVWLVSVGTRTVRSGLRTLVDRNDRRDLSIFQIGLRFIERCVTNAIPFQISLCSFR